MGTKTIKGILIDPVTRTVTEVEFADSLQAIYKLLDCQLIEAVDVGAGHTMYIDEEGLFVDDQRYFSFVGREHAPLGGKALIMGFDPASGENQDNRLKIENVRAITVWRNVELDEIKTTDRDTDDGFVVRTAARFKPKEDPDA